MEKTLTDKMYSTITNKRFFEQEVLNSGSEHYFYYKIQNFTKYKNSLLITNEELKHRYEVLSVFNNQIQSIMFEIIVSYRLVIDCNKTNEKLHFDGLKIRLNSKLEYINRFFIPSIRYNYDDNHLLGYKMNEYCISAFDTMFDKLENDYMIDIKKSPLFSSIENVYNKYLKLFDVEKMKVLSIPMHKPQQKETKEPQEPKAIEKEKKEIKPQETTTPKPDETEENKHPKHDPNYWNKECFELFKYLYNESYEGKIRQITNIWFYLNEFERNSINKKYILNCTKDRYKDFIKENYHITIKNFDKSTTNYEEKVYPKLNEHRQKFEYSLKQIAENVKNT